MSNNFFDIIMLIPSLKRGGAERIFVDLANYFSINYKVCVLLLKNEGDLKSELSNSIHIVVLNEEKTRRSLFSVYNFLRRTKSNYVFSTLWHMNVVLGLVIPLLKRKDRFFFARETNIQSLHAIDSVPKKLLTRFAYRRFSKVIAQSQDMKSDLAKNLNIGKNFIEVVNNGTRIFEHIELKQRAKHSLDFCEIKVLISIGRIEYQKGFDLLLESFSKINSNNYILLIIGTGSELESLKELSRKLGIWNRVLFLGEVSDVAFYYKIAYAFISSSRYEGYPNVVIEALCYGVPVVANNYVGGINEILNPQFGKIIDICHSDELERALMYVESLSRNDIKFSARSKFSYKKMCQQYEKIIFSNPIS